MLLEIRSRMQDGIKPHVQNLHLKVNFVNIFCGVKFSHSHLLIEHQKKITFGFELLLIWAALWLHFNDKCHAVYISLSFSIALSLSLCLPSNACLFAARKGRPAFPSLPPQPVWKGRDGVRVECWKHFWDLPKLFKSMWLYSALQHFTPQLF